MKKLTVKEIEEMEIKDFEKIITKEQYKRIMEMGFQYLYNFLDTLKDGARQSGLNDNEEYTTIEDYIEYWEDIKNQ